MVSGDRTDQAESRGPILQPLQPSKFRSPEHDVSRHSGKTFHTNWLRRAHIHYVSSNWAARSWIGRRQQSPDDCVSGTTRILKPRPTTPLEACAYSNHLEYGDAKREVSMRQ